METSEDAKAQQAEQPSTAEALQAEIERKDFARAAAFAKEHGASDAEVRRLEEAAVEYMAVQCRNATGTRRLAEHYGFTREDTETLLKRVLERAAQDPSTLDMRPCYDATTGAYLDFEEWVSHVLKNWGRLR